MKVSLEMLNSADDNSLFFLGKVCYQLTGSSDFTLKSLLPVNWQQRIYVKFAATS